jgi:hydroxyisourate hydrolase
MPAKLTTHVLDITRGQPAREMQIELWSLNGAQRQWLKTTCTNAEGRTDNPLLGPEEMRAGEYELVFYVGDYFGKQTGAESGRPFLNRVPVRFGIADEAASYHVPLLCSPWAYSTYRGS